MTAWMHVAIARADEREVAPEAAARSEAVTARLEIEATITKMAATSRHVRTMLSRGRAQGNTRQIVCLDESLSRADVARRSALRQAHLAFAAYSVADLAAGRTARARVADLSEAQRLAARAGAACGGVHVAVAEPVAPGTTVRLTIDPAIPPERDPSTP